LYGINIHAKYKTKKTVLTQAEAARNAMRLICPFRD
jgi:hypothetical protein